MSEDVLKEEQLTIGKVHKYNLLLAADDKCNPVIYSGLYNRNSLTANAIIDSICASLDIDKALLISKSRKRELVEARCIACFLIRIKLRLGLAESGKYINRDHSTVLYNVELFDILIEQSFDFKQKVLNVFKVLNLSFNEYVQNKQIKNN